MRQLWIAVAAVTASGAVWGIGDGPVISEHLDQARIEAGDVSFDTLMAAGGKLFSAKFNQYDGQGRPATTGGGAPRVAGSAPLFLRTSGPDSNSCAGCHNDPFPGAAGDVVANVFVLAQTLDPVTESVSGQFSNERNTLGMHGSGPIEMLAREMTVDLHATRDRLLATADPQSGGSAVLFSKGVSFGRLQVDGGGNLDFSEVQGIDNDLVVKPFHQKGVVISLREFSNNAMNHHHGMQSTERFGEARTGTTDFDADGVVDELTVGDITAVTLWQAALGTPGQVLPTDSDALRAVIVGERKFEANGCADCHLPTMRLSSREFVEPNPYNPAGNLQSGDVSQSYRFDMTQQGFGPFVEGIPGSGALVRAYTDLKRHNLCDDEIRHYCNEQVVQAGVGTEMFLTRKLWDVGNTAPYGHKGDLTTITEAIDVHGGEARASRDAYMALDQRSRDEIVEFLKSLQILPAGTASLVVDDKGRVVDAKHLAQLKRSIQ
ncbi:MAG: hypothetical protein KDI51_13155 [Xanthomonadales bacterium]|nr:hypothetical protein [Xanthomonadales bacterium]